MINPKTILLATILSANLTAFGSAEPSSSLPETKKDIRRPYLRKEEVDLIRQVAEKRGETIPLDTIGIICKRANLTCDESQECSNDKLTNATTDHLDSKAI